MIDHTIRAATSQAEDRVSLIIAAAKALRESQVEGYSPNSQAKFDELAIIYSITDKYVSNANWIPALYSREENFNLEHLVIPDQRAAKIKWNPNGNSFDIPIDPAFAKTNKKKKTKNITTKIHSLRTVGGALTASGTALTMMTALLQQAKPKWVRDITFLTMTENGQEDLPKRHLHQKISSLNFRKFI